MLLFCSNVSVPIMINNFIIIDNCVTIIIITIKIIVIMVLCILKTFQAKMLQCKYITKRDERIL